MPQKYNYLRETECNVFFKENILTRAKRMNLTESKEEETLLFTFKEILTDWMRR